jgi:hypothetical protein
MTGKIKGKMKVMRNAKRDARLARGNVGPTKLIRR